MTHEASRLGHRCAPNPAVRRSELFRFHGVSVVFVSLAALCVGCQSLPDPDRSRLLSNDAPLPPLPPPSPDDDDIDAQNEPRRPRASGPDSATDTPDLGPEPRPFLGFPIGKLLDDSPEDDDDERAPKRISASRYPRAWARYRKLPE